MKKASPRLNKLFIAFFVLMPNFFMAQKVLEITIIPEFDNTKFSFPFTLELPTDTFFSAERMVLYEVLDKKNKLKIPFQISNEGNQKVLWMVSPNSGMNKRFYELAIKDDSYTEVSSRIIDSGTSLTFVDGKDSLLRYQYEVMRPPDGVDSSYARSGFIHPLWTRKGHELTDIQPKDHYHHYGIWNPWTQVEMDGDTIDFWNLAKRQGTIRSAKVISKTEGPIFSELITLHEHVVFKDNMEKVVLNEVQRITVYPVSNEHFYIVDFEFVYNCATSIPFKILKYRYEGLGWRTRKYWDHSNSEVLTSTGKDRTNADGSKERWTIFQGALGFGFGGAIMMSHPSNYSHPEPIRVWPATESNGALFGAISTTRDKSWELQPGKKYTLKYRFIVFDGIMDAESAEESWKAFAFPPKQKLKRYK